MLRYNNKETLRARIELIKNSKLTKQNSMLLDGSANKAHQEDRFQFTSEK